MVIWWALGTIAYDEFVRGVFCAFSYATALSKRIHLKNINDLVSSSDIIV
jgi:hypothetical protein